ncbi:MAG: hypothetical protein AAGD13_14550 [Pseudomonadota bacterium]
MSASSQKPGNKSLAAALCFLFVTAIVFVKFLIDDDFPDWLTAAFSTVLFVLYFVVLVGFSVLIGRLLTGFSDWARSAIGLTGLVLSFAALFALKDVDRIDKDVRLLIFMIPLIAFSTLGAVSFVRAMIAVGSDPIEDPDGWRVHGFTSGMQWLSGGTCAVLSLLWAWIAYDNSNFVSVVFAILGIGLSAWGFVLTRRPQLAVREYDIWIRSWWHGWRRFDLRTLSAVRRLADGEYMGWELTFHPSGSVNVSMAVQGSEALIKEIEAFIPHN